MEEKISVFVRPREKSVRWMIYRKLSKEEKAGIKAVAFLPNSAYPPIRGRPPKYDFLQVIVSPIPQERGEKIKEYLRETLERDVYAVRRVKEKGKETWFYFLPWRNPITGKSLPNKMMFFRKIRAAILELGEKGETHIQVYLTKKSSDRENEFIGHPPRGHLPWSEDINEEIITHDHNEREVTGGEKRGNLFKEL